MPSDARLAQLDVPKLTSSSNIKVNPKLQKVQPYLRQRDEFARYYSPKLVSIGPIFRDKDHENNLKQGEQCKLLWAAKYIEDTHQSAQDLLQKIKANITTLKALYTEDAIQGHNDDDLAWIFFLDGCAVLYFMDKIKFESPEVGDLKIKVDQLVIVQQDLLLLENQLPYQVLELLCDSCNSLERYINNFFKNHHMTLGEVKLTAGGNLVKGPQDKQNEVQIDLLEQNSGKEPTHLLDLLRTIILWSGDGPVVQGKEGKKKQVEINVEKNSGKEAQPVEQPIDLLVPPGRNILSCGGGHDQPEHRKRDREEKWPTYRNIQELKAAGIQIRENKSSKEMTVIKFSSFLCFPTLHLSKLVVDDLTAPTFLNLIAYEMCPDFQNKYEISSYIAFLDSLIDHPDDVKDLRKAGVLHNSLGSDEEVAKLFNTISTDLVPDIQRYSNVRSDIENHCNKKYMTWMTQAYDSHFSSPWTFLAFLAAVTALVLSFIQTWFVFHPKNDPPPPCMKICK